MSESIWNWGECRTWKTFPPDEAGAESTTKSARTVTSTPGVPNGTTCTSPDDGRDVTRPAVPLASRAVTWISYCVATQSPVNEKVCRVANPVLEPVDREGHVLPLDPAYHRMDLPVLFRAGGGAALSSSQLQVLTLEVDRLGGDDPTFLAAVSEIAIDDRGDATALVGGDLLFRFRPPLSHGRLRDGLTVLEDAVRQRPDRRVAVLDLRFEDQIVLRYGRDDAPTQARGDD